MSRAFTLIELLIVVAIIAILAAIAVPNFLETQTRAKISRVKADMRTFATALEAYAVDFNTYPRSSTNNGTRGGVSEIIGLSTPVAYIGDSDIEDPFNTQRGLNPRGSDRWTITWVNIEFYREYTNRDWDGTPSWMANCYGPDRVKGPNPITGANWQTSRYGRKPPAPLDDDKFFGAWNYDPTNGTVSNGDINRWGP